MKLAFILIFFCLTAQAEGLFRWVDANGSVHYTDQPPPPTAKAVERKNLGGNYIETSQLPYATQQAVKNFPVTLYTSDCGEGCVKARELLVKRGVPFSEKGVSSVVEQEQIKKLVGSVVIPVMQVGSGAPLKGYNEPTWSSALTDAGYPLTAPIKTEKKSTAKTETKAAPDAPLFPGARP